MHSAREAVVVVARDRFWSIHFALDPDQGTYLDWPMLSSCADQDHAVDRARSIANRLKVRFHEAAP